MRKYLWLSLKSQWNKITGGSIPKPFNTANCVGKAVQARITSSLETNKQLCEGNYQVWCKQLGGGMCKHRWTRILNVLSWRTEWEHFKAYVNSSALTIIPDHECLRFNTVLGSCEHQSPEMHAHTHPSPPALLGRCESPSSRWKQIAGSLWNYILSQLWECESKPRFKLLWFRPCVETRNWKSKWVLVPFSRK